MVDCGPVLTLDRPLFGWREWPQLTPHPCSYAFSCDTTLPSDSDTVTRLRQKRQPVLKD